jgi:hypothetical protein
MVIIFFILKYFPYICYMVNRKYIERIYKIHNFKVEVDKYTDGKHYGWIFIILFDDSDLHEHGNEYHESISNLITWSNCTYKHDIFDAPTLFDRTQNNNEKHFLIYNKEIITRIYTYFVENMNVNPNEFRYVWDLFVKDTNHILFEKLDNLFLNEPIFRHLNINTFLLPTYDKIYDLFIRDKNMYSDGIKKINFSYTTRSNNFTLFNQECTVRTFELTF